MNEERFIKKIKAFIKSEYTDQTTAAKAWGLSDTYVYHVLKGKSYANRPILLGMGYKRTITTVEDFDGIEKVITKTVTYESIE